MPQYLLAHDLGTSGNKATLFSTDGRLIKSQTVPYDAHYFNGTWVEQDAGDWWNAVCKSTGNLIAEAGIDATDIKAVSFSGQMMGCLCVDRNGIPLRPSIIWADQRALAQAEAVSRHVSQEKYYETTGHRNTASYGLVKFMWIKENEPEIYEQTYKMLNAKDYIVFRLTGRFYTDYSDACSCGFFDLKRLTWSEDLLRYTGVSPEKLPEPKPSTFCAGGVTKEAASLTGLKENTPVIMGAGDGVATNVGAGSVEPGKTFCCLGTSAWITTTSTQPLYDPQMRTVTWPHMAPGLYAPNGTMQYAGGAYNWLKNTVCKTECQDASKNGCSPYDLINSEIEKSPIGAGGLLFLPYLLGERAPRWDPFAKGCWIGLKPETTRGDLCRSVLEGVTMNLALILDVLRSQESVASQESTVSQESTASQESVASRLCVESMMVLGGGARGNVWRQMLSDVLETRITVPALLDEAGSMGAAVNAGVGAGIFKDFHAIDRFITVHTVHEPNPDAVAAYQPVRALFDECYYALKDVFQKF